MTDSTNPRVMADNIKELYAGLLATNAQVEALQTYDEDETATGEIWIDGKPIYQKVFKVANLPNTTSENVSHGVTDLGTVIYLGGVMQGGGSDGRPIPNSNQIILNYTASNIRITTNTDFSNNSGIIIFKYTKADPTP